MIRRLFVLVALLVALSQPCVAQTRFLPADCTALVDLLPAPPADDSVVGRAELEVLLHVQAERTPEQIARAKRVADQTFTSFAQPVLGDWLRPADFPKTKAIFDAIDKERRTIVDDQVKRRWNRTRPYIRSTDVQPVVGKPNNTSYPSGHASAAALWGTIYAAAFPEKAAQFKLQVREAMWGRVLGGVHYPSDIEAGTMLGEAIGKAMLESPEMKTALETIRAELAPHLAKNPAAPAQGNNSAPQTKASAEPQALSK